MFFAVLLALFLISGACNKKPDDQTRSQDQKKEFGWKDNISVSDIPDFTVKGNLNGKEVQFGYINFEKWHGSNDNVINFSVRKPEQNCGFIENFEGFTLMNMGAEIKNGDWIKAKFGDDPKTYQAFFKNNGEKSSSEWNCALNIESITDKAVKGRIALFFNDGAKSWIAGKFEAVICNN